MLDFIKKVKLFSREITLVSPHCSGNHDSLKSYQTKYCQNDVKQYSHLLVSIEDWLQAPRGYMNL
jgi:hypothetical protein